MGKSTVEERLAQYRARKKKDEEYAKRMRRLKEIFSWFQTLWSFEWLSDMLLNKETQEEDQISSEIVTSYPSSESVRHRSSSDKNITRELGGSDQQLKKVQYIFQNYEQIDWVILGLKIMLWVILFKIFVLYEFGAVYFIFSAFVFIWMNMRSGPKQEGEVSAYSVFNPKCETIDGTLDADKLQKQMLFM